MDSGSSERVLVLILGSDGGSEIPNLSFLLSDLWPDCVMVPKLSALVKESCKYLFSPHSSCAVTSAALCSQSSPLVSFFSQLCQEGRDQQENSAEQGAPCRATGAVTWPEIAPSPKPDQSANVGKYKCAVCFLTASPHTSQQLCSQHCQHRAGDTSHMGLEIATLYWEWVLIGEKNSSRELSRDFEGLHFPEAKFNLWLFCCFFGLIFF